MGRPRPTNSQLIQTLSLLYEMDASEVQALADEILSLRTKAWQRGIENEATKYGFSGSAKPPRGGDLADLRRQSLEDARSIRNTLNQELRRRLTDLYTANPKGNRNYYNKNIGDWLAQRDPYKAQQIALYSEQTARTRAREIFRNVLGIRGGEFIYDGVAPVGKVCIERFALGVVDENYTDANPTPAHPNCPHSWREVNPKLPAGIKASDVQAFFVSIRQI